MRRHFETWKVRREVQRLKQQLRAVPEFFYEPLLRWWHDHARTRRIQVREGMLPAKAKVAIYLLFQPAGVAKSSIETCRHLIDKGYAPLAISNAALSDEDRRRLSEVCWRVVERPNFGYDFGGYRDGIWLLGQWRLEPQTLILMNDSVWFPVMEGDRTIEAMESMPEGFRGILKLGTAQGSVWGRRRDPFLGSFFLMFSAQAVASAAFGNFWRHYRNTSNKYKTIRRGERRLSYAMREAGFEGASVFDGAAFDSWLAQAPTAKLRQLLDELVTLNSEIGASIERAASAFDACDANGREGMKATLRDVILQATAKSNLFSSAPLTMLREFRLPFVKKAMDPWNLQALRRIQRFANECQNTLPLTASFRQELAGRLASRARA